MGKADLTPKHVLPVFVFICIWLMASRGQVAPTDHLYAPTQEVVCECEHDECDCADLRSRRDAQECFDYCRWWTQSYDDVHHLDADGDGVVCEPTPVPGAEYVFAAGQDRRAPVIRQEAPKAGGTQRPRDCLAYNTTRSGADESDNLAVPRLFMAVATGSALLG